MTGRSAWAMYCALLALLAMLGRDSAHDPVDGLMGVQPQFVGPVQPEVSLDDPTALEELRYRNPEHYRKITELLSGLHEHNELDEARWAKVITIEPANRKIIGARQAGRSANGTS